MKIEVANTTLSRLVAGDFLESLGKELGLEVPPDQPYPNNHSKPQPTQKAPSVQEHPRKHEAISSDAHKDISRTNTTEFNHGGLKKETMVKRDKSSSDDERSRKRSKGHRGRRSGSDGYTSESSDEYRDRHSSRYKDRKKEHRKHSKHRKHRSHESSSRSRHSEDKEYGDGKREKRRRRD